MRAFFSGFEKRAADEKEPLPAWAKYVIPAVAAGATTAAVSYAVGRSGGKKLVSMVGHADPKTVPQSAIGRFINKIRFGADDVIHTTKATLKQSDPLKTLNKNEVALVREPAMRRFIDEGEGQIFGTTAAAESLMENKLKESNFIRSIVPSLHPETEAYNLRGDVFDRLDRMKRIHEKWTKSGKGYYIKPTKSMQSGPGGENIISHKDIQGVIDGTLSPDSPRGSLIKSELLLGDISDDFMIQRALSPVTDPVTRKGIEFRVHSVGDKVIDTTLRTSITPNPLEARRATEVMKEFVEALPEKMKKEKAMFAADVLKTKDGYKIVETNPGGASGYLDPIFMKQHGRIPELKSIILNNKLYEHLAGRKSPLMAAGRATAVGAASAGLAAGGAYVFDHRDELGERFKS